MIRTIFGQKLAMGEQYVGSTRRVVTAIKLFPMTVAQIKSLDQDGYQSLQVKVGPKAVKHEIAFQENISVGTLIKPEDVIVPGAICTVIGTSKGKGFAGVVKRWGFSGGPRTHGQSDRLRAPGSIGQGTTPGRVHKGKKMAGRLGGDRVTIKHVTLLKYDQDSQIAWVTGPVPGGRNASICLEVTRKETP